MRYPTLTPLAAKARATPTDRIRKSLESLVGMRGISAAVLVFAMNDQIGVSHYSTEGEASPVFETLTDLIFSHISAPAVVPDLAVADYLQTDDSPNHPMTKALRNLATYNGLSGAVLLSFSSRGEININSTSPSAAFCKELEGLGDDILALMNAGHFDQALLHQPAIGSA